MTKEDLQKELVEKLKVGVKPSHLKRSASTPVKSVSKDNDQTKQIKQLEQDKAQLLIINQEAVKQNEQLAQAITKLQQEKKNLEEQILELRLTNLKTPLNKDKSNLPHSPIKRTELEKNVLIIFLLITLSGALLLK
jgi:hypothetical protein